MNPLPFRDYTRDPNIKAFERNGLINHGSTVCENCSL